MKIDAVVIITLIGVWLTTLISFLSLDGNAQVATLSLSVLLSLIFLCVLDTRR